MRRKKTSIQPAKTKKRRSAQAPAAETPTPPLPQEGKLSALSAAARVLAETGQAMNCRQLIEAMAAQGYWTSPAGRTPEGTLAAAMAREIRAQGAQARFRKVDRGLFAANTPA